MMADPNKRRIGIDLMGPERSVLSLGGCGPGYRRPPRGWQPVSERSPCGDSSRPSRDRAAALSMHACQRRIARLVTRRAREKRRAGQPSTGMCPRGRKQRGCVEEFSCPRAPWARRARRRRAKAAGQETDGRGAGRREPDIAKPRREHRCPPPLFTPASRRRNRWLPASALRAPASPRQWRRRARDGADCRSPTDESSA